MRDFDAVYAVVRAIPRGKVKSYGQVGAEANVSPRTAGWALGNVPDGVPWHRVVAYNGYLSIAKRDPHLRQLQASLLAEEGVTVSDAGYVAKEFFADEDEPSATPA